MALESFPRIRWFVRTPVHRTIWMLALCIFGLPVVIWDVLMRLISWLNPWGANQEEREQRRIDHIIEEIETRSKQMAREALAFGHASANQAHDDNDHGDDHGDDHGNFDKAKPKQSVNRLQLDFGDSKFHRIALKTVLPELYSSAMLHVGKTLPFGHMLERKLLMMQFWETQRHRDESIGSTASCDNPIFIVSLPRTGSTLLHNLFGFNEHVRTIEAWEFKFPPGITPSNAIHGSSFEERKKKTQNKLETFYRICPRIRQIHHVDCESPDECVQGFVDCSIPEYYLWGAVDMPNAFAWYTSQPLLPQYENYRKLLEMIVSSNSSSGSDYQFSTMDHAAISPSTSTASTIAIGQEEDEEEEEEEEDEKEEEKEKQQQEEEEEEEDKRKLHRNQLADSNGSKFSARCSDETPLVLKSPHHIVQLSTAREVFPAARFIWIHRDPADLVLSCCNMNAALLDYASAYYFDLHELGQRTLTCLHKCTQIGLLERENLEAAGVSFIDVYYPELKQDPGPIMVDIFRRLGLPDPSKQYLDKVKAETRGQPDGNKNNHDATENDNAKSRSDKSRERERRQLFSLEDFGLSRDGIHQQFSDYLKLHSRILPHGTTKQKQ